MSFTPSQDAAALKRTTSGRLELPDGPPPPLQPEDFNIDSEEDGSGSAAAAAAAAAERIESLPPQLQPAREHLRTLQARCCCGMSSLCRR